MYRVNVYNVSVFGQSNLYAFKVCMPYTVRCTCISKYTPYTNKGHNYDRPTLWYACSLRSRSSVRARHRAFLSMRRWRVACTCIGVYLYCISMCMYVYTVYIRCIQAFTQYIHYIIIHRDDISTAS